MLQLGRSAIASIVHHNSLKQCIQPSLGSGSLREVLGIVAQLEQDIANHIVAHTQVENMHYICHDIQDGDSWQEEQRVDITQSTLKCQP